MSNPIAQFLRIEMLVREIYSSTIPIYESNSRGAIFYCDKTTCYKSRPAEENGKKNKENEKGGAFMSCQSFGIISISAPLFKRGWHFVASFLQFCFQWRKRLAKSRGFARSGALGQPGAGHGLASLSGRRFIEA